MKNKTQRPNLNKQNYFAHLCNTNAFFVAHKDANHLNAQDVIYDLLRSAKNISIVTCNCFGEDSEQLVINDAIFCNLISEIQTKLAIIEKLLPLAFQKEEL